MKEILPDHEFLKDEEVNEQQIPQAKARVHSRQKIRGLQVFELDVSEQRINLIKPIATAVVGLDGQTVMKNRVQMRRNCIYCQALNLKNAERKFGQMIRDEVGKHYGMFCTDEEWRLLTFAQRLRLIHNLKA